MQDAIISYVPKDVNSTAKNTRVHNRHNTVIKLADK